MINIVLGSVTVLLLLLVLWTMLHGGRKTAAVSQQDVALKDLSKLWAKGRDSGELHIQELAPLWRDNILGQSSQAPVYIFENKRAAAFFRSHVEQAPWFGNASAQRDVCYQILMMLEKEGSCPSVVKAADDVEASWDSNTYSLLGKTTLLDHTLNVAEEAVALLLDADAQHVIPDTLIAALGHDLGKLPSIQGHLYSLGEHPLAAGRVLAEIVLFKKLPKKEEISRAIKLHHKRPEGLLGKTLKKADQQARQKELERAVEEVAEKENAQKEATPPPVETLPDPPKNTPEAEAPHEPAVRSEPVVTPPLPSNASESSGLSSPGQGAGSAWQAQADIYGEEEAPAVKKRSDVPQLMDISAWFDAQAFLDDLRPYINRITGRRFMGFSMADGYVYLQAKVLEEVARKQAEKAGAMDIATLGPKDKTMQQVLLTIVNKLRVEDEVIARELVKEQYFGGYFLIHTQGGREMKGFYTPFHAEAFGSIAEMEHAKTGLLKKFKSVEPYLND